MQNHAEVVNSGCVQRLVFAELVDRRTGDMVILDERICGLGGHLQCRPESIIYDHGNTLPADVISILYFMVCYLTIVIKKTIIK